MVHSRLLPVTLACVLAASAAHAQTKAPAISLAQPTKALDLSAPGLPVLYSRAPAALPPGIARTSVERKVAGDGVLSSGVLCGIQPSADTSGASRARCFDPDGKFVGAKMAFKF
ncbi:hypothetical protein BH10PSE3_BH10PSE3_31170 [soil metagenome]